MNDLTNFIEWIQFADEKKTVLEVLTILNNRHRDAVAAVESERDQLSRELSSLLAADCLNGHDATEGAQNGIAMRKALEEAQEALLTFNDVGNCRAFHDAKDKALRLIAPFLPIPETTSLQS